MPSNPLGVSFAPTFENAEIAKSSGRSSGPQDALEVLSFRLPKTRVTGGLSPLMGDTPSGASPNLRVLERVFRTILGPEAAAALLAGDGGGSSASADGGGGSMATPFSIPHLPTTVHPGGGYPDRPEPRPPTEPPPDLGGAGPEYPPLSPNVPPRDPGPIDGGFDQLPGTRTPLPDASGSQTGVRDWLRHERDLNGRPSPSMPDFQG